MTRKLGLTLASALVALGAAEMIVRVGGLGVHDLFHELRKYGVFLVLDDGGFQRHPPDTRVVLQGVTLRFNSLGMRDDEPRVPKPPGVFRIPCLGDSVTLGPGVDQDAIYPSRQRTLLAAEGIDVVMAGVSGWNTVAEERFLVKHAQRLVPDLVMLLYVSNDNEVDDGFEGVRELPSGWGARLYRTLLQHSQLFEWTVFIYQTRIAPRAAGVARLYAWHKLQEEAHGMAPFTTRDRGWQASRVALARMLTLLQAQNARLVIFVWNQMNGPIERQVLARVQEFGAETGVPVFDTFPFFASCPAVEVVNDTSTDPHPNAFGHGLLAAGIAGTLRTAGLVPAPPVAAAGEVTP